MVRKRNRWLTEEIKLKSCQKHQHISASSVWLISADHDLVMFSHQVLDRKIPSVTRGAGEQRPARATTTAQCAATPTSALPPLPAPPIHQAGHDTRIAAPLMWRQSGTQSEPRSTVGTALLAHVHRSTPRAPKLQN